MNVMRNLLIYIYCFHLIIFSSCNNQNHKLENSHKLRRIVNKNKIQVGEALYLNDSIQDGAFKIFYPNTKKVRLVGYVRMDHEMGSGYCFSLNGKVSKYALLGHHGLKDKDWLSMYYDTITGEFIKKIGYLTATVEFSNFTNLDSIPLNEKVFCEYIVATPPNCNTEASVFINSLNSTKLKLPIENCFATYAPTFTEPGKLKIILRIDVDDTLRHLHFDQLDTTIITVVK